MQNEYDAAHPDHEDALPSLHDLGYLNGPVDHPPALEWLSENGQAPENTTRLGLFDLDQAHPSLPAGHQHLGETVLRERPAQDFRIERYERQARQLQHLRDASSPFFRRLKRLATLREDVLLLRMRVSIESDNCDKHSTLYSKYQDAFMQEAQGVLDKLPEDVSLRRLRSRHDQAAEVRRRHDGYAESARELRTQLESKEVKMAKLEEQVRDAAYKMGAVLQKVTFPAESGSATAVETSVSSDQSVEGGQALIEPPAPLQHYFDKVGDVKLGRDRLYELDQQHMEEKARRQFERDKEIPLAVSEAEFEERWLQIFAEAELAYTQATKKADLAFKVCESEGLNPDDYRKVSGQADQNQLEASPRADDLQDAPTPSTYPHDGSQEVPVFTPHTAQLDLEQLDVAETDMDAYLDPFAPRRKKSKQPGSPLATRVEAWMSKVDAEPSAPSKMLHEPAAIPTVHVDDFDILHPGKPYRFRSHRSSQASHQAIWAEEIEGQERPMPIKRSSSESELRIFQLQPEAKQRVFESWQSGNIGRYGLTPTKHRF